MNTEIERHFEPIFRDIARTTDLTKGQILVASLDKDLLFLFTKEFARKSEYESVYIKSDFERDKNPDGKIFFIFLEERRQLKYQSLLYYYLELVTVNKCFVCLLSTSANCLSFLEKRNRSRFKNNIFFIPYLYTPDIFLRNTNTLTTINEKSISPSIERKKIFDFMQKYQLEEFDLNFIFKMLNSIHFAILILAKDYRFTYKTVYNVFKKNMVEIKILRGVSDRKIIRFFFDLIEFGLISDSGILLVDYTEIRKYIEKNEPKYLLTLMKSLQ